ncbi:MAG TPA: hypothetical protein VND64_26075 [Pirellulales bacterium]|nr:hypothetical protein [Pirellulales bacterium]
MIRREPTSRKPVQARRRAKPEAKPNDSIAQTLVALDQMAPQSPKAKRLAAVLRGWLTDESGYDEETWPKLKKALDRERARVGGRRLFDA